MMCSKAFNVAIHQKLLDPVKVTLAHPWRKYLTALIHTPSVGLSWPRLSPLTELSCKGGGAGYIGHGGYQCLARVNRELE